MATVLAPEKAAFRQFKNPAHVGSFEHGSGVPFYEDSFKPSGLIPWQEHQSSSLRHWFRNGYLQRDARPGRF